MAHPQAVLDRTASCARVLDAGSGRPDEAPFGPKGTALNPGSELRIYPGSPLIVKALLRRQDRLVACELEPNAAAALKATRPGGRAGIPDRATVERFLAEREC